MIGAVAADERIIAHSKGPVTVLPSKLRTNGHYDLMRKIHLDKGVVYLANTGGSPGTAFRMFVDAKLKALTE